MFYAMSSVDASPLWIGEEAPVKSKYEKCQDITTEIYKRINITFAIKQLQSKDVVSDGDDQSEPIDSNELSNGTDLFAYEKTDSLSSSVTLDDGFKDHKVINLNNNEEMLKKPRQRIRCAKKRFRKRVKKKPQRKLDTDCSSDEEPLSRMVVDCKKRLVKVVKPPEGREEEQTKRKDEKSEAEEKMLDQVAKEYEYFTKVMEKVPPEESDLDTVLMPALYPEVDLYERKLGLPTKDDLTYYTFADLVTAGPSTSQPRSPNTEYTKVNNVDGAVASESRNGEAILDLSIPNVTLKPVTLPSLTAEKEEALSLASQGQPEPIDLCVERAGAGARKRAQRRPKRAEERKECEHCKMSFSGVRGLRRHLKSRCIARVSDASHGMIKEYWCSECDYRCQSEVSLRRHVSVHNKTTAEKKYACGECERRYTQRSTLRIHALTHRGERPHRCHTCHKSFTRYDTWKRHQRVHTKVTAPTPAPTDPAPPAPGPAPPSPAN